MMKMLCIPLSQPLFRSNGQSRHDASRKSTSGTKVGVGRGVGGRVGVDVAVAVGDGDGVMVGVGVDVGVFVGTGELVGEGVTVLVGGGVGV